MILRDLFKRALDGALTRPSVTTSLAQMNDPARRPDFSQLLGFTRVKPEEPQKEGDASPAPTPAAGPDQPGG